MLLQVFNYTFSLYALPVFIIGIAIISLGLFVLVRERSAVGVSFLLMSTNVGLYLVFSSLTFATPNIDISLALLWGRIANFGAIWIPSSIFLLITVLTGLYRKYRLALAASVVVSTLFSLGLFFTDLFIRRIETFFWGRYSQYGPLGYAFVGFFIIIMVAILHLLWREHQQSTGDIQKKRYRGLLVAFIGGYFGSVDFLPAFGIPLYPFGYLFVGFFIATTTYVILRYRLVDITPELAADRILETMQGAVIVTGGDGRIRVINSNALEMLGYLKSELLGRALTEVLPIPPELIASVRAEGRAVSREMTWKGRTGQHIVNLASSLLTDKRGTEPIGIVYAATDITERKRVEEALQLHEERLRMAMDATRQGWFDLNVQTGEVSVSPEYARMIGYDPGELQTNLQAWLDALHPDDSSTIMNAYQQCLATGGPVTMEYRRRTKTGEWKWIRSIGKVVESDAGGKPLRMIGTHTDISDRKHTEAELQRSEQFNKRILDSVDEGFIVVDRDYRILTVNKAYCDQVGMLPTEVVGNHCYRVSHKRNRPCFEEGENCPVRKVFETGTPHTAHHVLSSPTMMSVETKAFPLSIESGTITTVIESVSNITEKHLLETERLKTQKLEAIGTLAGGIAHDFNNLLQGVFGYISLAKLNVDSKEKTRDSLEQAEKALHMSVKLTNQLLTFSKGGKPVKKRIDLRPVLDDAVKFALSGSRSVCDMAAQDGLWQAEADEGQISQVIQNIVLNADQAMPEGGKVEISARNVTAPDKSLPKGLQQGRYVAISITDSGVGISEQYLEKIFDPYFTTKERGSGLGLATSYSIIKNHNGMIDVSSTKDGGSIFTIYIPALAEQKEAAVKPAEEAGAGRTGRVLLMDDEQLVLGVAGALIRALGHEVEFAAHGGEAIDKYRTAMENGRAFEVVILDLTIKGGMGGVETVRSLLQIDPHVKAIVSSGYSDDAAAADYEKQGFKAFLKKPYDVNALDQILNKTLNA